MKLYRTKSTKQPTEPAQWSHSGESAGKVRKAMRSEGLAPSTEQVEVPTKKLELVAWLNKNCA
jgi:hypothetical protein